MRAADARRAEPPPRVSQSATRGPLAVARLASRSERLARRSDANLLFLIEDRQPAIDQVRRPGDVVAVTRRQEDRETSHVIRLAQPVERDLPNQRLELDRVVQELRIDRRLDRT